MAHYDIVSKYWHAGMEGKWHGEVGICKRVGWAVGGNHITSFLHEIEALKLSAVS